MERLFVGVDVSKGYVDIECVNQAGSILKGGNRFDDTRSGHNAVLHWLEKHSSSRNGEVSFEVGIESSGGLERNWLTFFRDLSERFSLKVFHLNPLAVKRFLERDLHRNVTDRISARGIAFYLRSGIKPTTQPFAMLPSGSVHLYRALRNAIGRSAEIQNELQSILPSAFPELVQYCRGGIPDWMLALLMAFPTVNDLRKATSEDLVSIPHVTEAKALEILNSVEHTVSSRNDPHLGQTIGFLASEIRHARDTIASLKKGLIQGMKENPDVIILTSIPGIGPWTGVSLILEIGCIDRFPSAAALTAFSGLDPRIRQSGDREKHVGISRKGRREIRAMLYPAVMTGIQHNPIIKEYYARLRARGKGHMVSITACMRKLLHIAYGCLIRKKLFDPNYEATRQQVSPKPMQSEARELPARQPDVGSLNAPVSRREARKRRAALTPQTAINRTERGLEAAPARVRD